MTNDYSNLIARLRDMMYRVSRSDAEKLGEISDALTHLSQRVAELEAKNAAWVQQKIDADARIAALESQAKRNAENWASEREDHVMRARQLNSASEDVAEFRAKVTALESQLAARESAESVAWLLPNGSITESSELAATFNHARALIHPPEAEASAEPVGVATFDVELGTFWEMRVSAKNFPIGTKVFAHPPAAEASDYVLSLLVAAGHVSQEKIDEARRIARRTPGAAAASEDAEPAARNWYDLDQ